MYTLLYTLMNVCFLLYIAIGTPVRLLGLLSLYILYYIFSTILFLLKSNKIYLYFYDNMKLIHRMDIFLSSYNRKKYKTAKMTVLQYPKGCNSNGHPLTEYKAPQQNNIEF